MVQRTAPPITLCARGVGAATQLPIQRVLSIGLQPEAALVGCIVEGASRSISGQIAVTLTLDSVLRGLTLDGASDQEVGHLIREGFRESNQAVYDYAHRMRAGAAIGASLLLWGIHHGKMVIGRSGRGEVFLLRAGGVTPLFEASPHGDGARADGVLERFIGANAKVLVDLATTSISEGDELLFLNAPTTKPGRIGDFRELVTRILRESQPAADRLAAILSGLGDSHAGMIVGYGNQAIELRERIAEPSNVDRSGGDGE